MNSAMISDRFQQDCLQVLELLKQWPGPWQPLVELFNQQHALVCVGEGSSRLFPATFVSYLAKKWGYIGSIQQAGGREAASLPQDQYQPIWLSNSGSTREVIECARTWPNGLAIVGQTASQLGQLANHERNVLIREEQSIAATASVFAQAFVLAEALATACKIDIPYDQLKVGIENILTSQVDSKIIQTLRQRQRLWWADNGDGVGLELGLKTMEITGKIGIHAPGTLLLHGIEEVLDNNDAIIWFSPPSEDEPLLESAIIQATEAAVIIDPIEISQARELDAWQPLLQLVAGWKILSTTATDMGRDPATAQRARKVGNPLL